MGGMSSGFLISIFSLLCACCQAAHAQPAIRCTVSYGDEPQVLEFGLGVHPYDAKAVDVGGRFKFKAVLLGADQVAVVKLYVYAIDSSGAQMLQEARYHAPFSPQDRPDALTGEQVILTQALGRQLRYGCALVDMP